MGSRMMPNTQSNKNQPGIIPITMAPADTANRKRSSCRCSMMVMVFSPDSSSAGTDTMGCDSSATLIRPQYIEAPPAAQERSLPFNLLAQPSPFPQAEGGFRLTYP